MSQRLGPADGRAFTIATSAKLFDNYLMSSHDIPYVNNYEYRRLLQSQGPNVVQSVQKLQTHNQEAPAPSQVNKCHNSNRALLKVPGIY